MTRSAEGRSQKDSTTAILLSTFCLLLCAPARANDLSVDRRTVRVGDSITITLSLEDSFATIDDVQMPGRNLLIGSTPSTSSEFSWINGTVVRRKVFRFLARAIQPGPAQVGPLTISLPDGQRQTVPAIPVQILPDRAALSNDPVAVLRELLATGRDPFFVVGEVDKPDALVGEQVVVTWWLYNAASVQEWQIGSVPTLAEFWTEEVDVRSAQPVQSFVGDYPMQRMPIRKVALYPLKSGELPIGSMEVEAAVMRRTDDAPFGMFEGNVVEVSFASAPLSVNVHPLPAGAPSLVGDLTLSCSPPRQKNGGPVLIDVMLSGSANIRSARAPGFESKPAADVQVVERGTSLERNAVPSMTRRWQYLLFPDHAGKMAIPALTLETFSPSAHENRTLRCVGTTLTVSAVERNRGQASSPQPPAQQSSAVRRAVLAALLTAISGLLAVVIARAVIRRRRESAKVRQLVQDRSPAQIREAVHERLGSQGIGIASLMRERSDRGDAYRALRSLLDALEHDRITADASEVRRRVRELLESVQSAA